MGVGVGGCKTKNNVYSRSNSIDLRMDWPWTGPDLELDNNYQKLIAVLIPQEVYGFCVVWMNNWKQEIWGWKCRLSWVIVPPTPDSSWCSWCVWQCALGHTCHMSSLWSYWECYPAPGCHHTPPGHRALLTYRSPAQWGHYICHTGTQNICYHPDLIFLSKWCQ